MIHIFNNWFKKVISKDIVKVFSLTTIATLVRMLTGLVSIKIVAVIVGPAGIALLGQLNNFTSIVMSGASGGINNGVTKYIAEYKDSEDKVSNLLSTALQITFVCSLSAGVLTAFFNEYLSKQVMNSPEYGYIFIIFGVTLFLYALNMLFTSIINGFKEYRRYVNVNIAGSIFGLFFTLGLIFLLHLKGALISAVTSQSILFFITIYISRKSLWLKKSFFIQKFSTDIAKKYFRYTLMTLVTAIAMPLSQFFLRTFVISKYSLHEAGWWESMNRMSAMYLMVITSSFGVYYLPRLSELKNNEEIRREIIKSYKLILPILLITLTTIYLFRDLIIKLLFTHDFLPMSNLFKWQLIGDFFKIASWLIAFLMIAKSMIKIYIITEIIFAFSMISMGVSLIKIYGISGLTIAYAINYFVYFICMLIVFRKIILK